MFTMKEVIDANMNGGKNMNEKSVYTVAEIQTILGVGKNKAYALCTSGLFTFKRIGKSILVPKTAFENWLLNGDVA